MVKKVFALASVTALTGLMISIAASGCSSTTTVEPSGDATPDVVVKDVNHPDTSPVDSGPATCPTTAAIDESTLPFKAPNTPVPGACTDADLIAMEKEVDTNSSTTFKNIAAKASATCAACAFGDASATTWTPVVYGASDGTNTADIINSGACVSVVSGTTACGKSYAEFSDCLQLACQDCASGSAAESACFTAVQMTGAACATESASLTTACGSNVNAYIQTCDDVAKECTTCGGQSGAVKYTFEVQIVALCVKPPAPAGDGGDGG